MGDIDAARALNYKGVISLYEFSRAHNRRSAELVQKYFAFVIERSARLYIAHQFFIPPSQLSFYSLFHGNLNDSRVPYKKL